MVKDLQKIVVLCVLVIAGGFLWYYSTGQSIGPHNQDGDQVVCTADAMQCPDGTWVGRTGSNCEFVCPGDSGGSH